MSITEVRNKAKEILKLAGIRSAPVNVEEIASFHNLSVVPYNFGSEVSGALYSEKGRATIGYNPLEGDTRKRFTIAHELGHYFLHFLPKSKPKEEIFIDKKGYSFYRDQNSTSGEVMREKEANAFAAEILMPEEIIKKEIQNIVDRKAKPTEEKLIEELAEKFKVSSVAMTHRLTNLKFFEPHLGLKWSKIDNALSEDNRSNNK